MSAAAVLVTLAVAVVFLAPMIDLMPAPQAKQFSPSTLVFAVALLFPIITTLLESHIALWKTVEIVPPGFERLETICIHRC